MTGFSYSRSEGFPTQYPPNHTPVTVDVLEAGFIAAFIILGLCFFVSLPSTRLKHNAFLFVRVTSSLLIGLFILLANFGQEWEVGHLVADTPYRVGTGHEIKAEMDVKIGLRSVNVTLKSEPDKDGPLKSETINYNERFEWTWDQGRFGFGPYAGHLQRQFRAAQYRGLPLPILWIMDYFVIDGEGFRFGRFYRTAGWYTHIVLWTAFPCWLLANIFFRSVIRYGAYFLGMAGALLLFANLLWLVIRNPIPLEIPFDHDKKIIFKFGFSYWLTFFTGIICLVLGAIITFLEATNDTVVSIFFGIDPLTYLDEYVLTQKEVEVLRRKDAIPKDMLPLTDMEAGPANPSLMEPNTTQTVFLKRRSTIRLGGGMAQIKRMLPPKEEEQPLYGNMDTIREEQQRLDKQQQHRYI